MRPTSIGPALTRRDRLHIRDQIARNDLVWRAHEIAQKFCHFRAVRQHDRCKLRARFLRHAELHAPAEQQSGDDPVLRAMPETVAFGCAVSSAMACFCASVKYRRADCTGGRGVAICAVVKPFSRAGFPALVPTAGRAAG